MKEVTQAVKLHQAEEYLRNPDNPQTLYIRYLGEKRRLFINDRKGDIYMLVRAVGRKGMFSKT